MKKTNFIAQHFVKTQILVTYFLSQGDEEAEEKTKANKQ